MRTKWGLAIAAATLAVLALAGPAQAKNDKDNGPPASTQGNNLSVPTVFVDAYGGAAPPSFTGTCDGVAVDPTGPVTNYALWEWIAGAEENDGYWQPTGETADFFVQKTAAVWNAACLTAAPGTTEAGIGLTFDWGDNLTGTTALAAESVITVEAGLYADGTTMDGYSVMKLQPTSLDRVSAYGIQVEGYTDGVPYATSTSMQARVWDEDAYLTIEVWDATADGGAGDWVDYYAAPMGSEVNSMGAVVYGFNWGIDFARPGVGQYRLTFSLGPNADGFGLGGFADTYVTAVADDALVTVEAVAESGEPGPGPTSYVSPDGQYVQLTIDLASTRGGGGGGGNSGGNGGGGNSGHGNNK